MKMQEYTEIILQNPLSSLRDIYRADKIKRASNALLLVYGIVILLPEELILHIISFLFREDRYVNLYYREYTLHDALSLYQAVMKHNLYSLFLYPDKTRLIMDLQDNVYVTFEEYEEINDVDESMRNIIGDSYVSPPITFIKHNIKCLLIVNAIIFCIITAIVIGVVILYLYGISIDAVIILTPGLYAFFIFICICTSCGMAHDFYNKSRQVKNYHSYNK